MIPNIALGVKKQVNTDKVPNNEAPAILHENLMLNLPHLSNHSLIAILLLKDDLNELFSRISFLKEEKLLFPT